MRYKQISLDLFGDRYPWAGYEHDTGDNTEAFARMKRALLLAIENELTEHQRRVVYAYYFDGKTVTTIAEQFGVNKSTVTRHLQRARLKLKRCLRYAFYPDMKD